MTAPLPLRASRGIQGGGGGLSGEDAGQVVRDGHPDADGWAVGVAREVEQPTVADPDPVESGPLRVRAVLAEGGDPDPHEAWIQVGRCDVPALERPGPEVLDDDIDRRREGSQQLLTVGQPQVDGHASPAASLDRPEERVALVGERPDLAHEVAAAGLLDLDDLRPLLAQEPGAERRRDAGAEVEDAESLERSGHHTRSRPGGPGRSGHARRARDVPVGVGASLTVYADSPACSAFTASMPPLLRASVRPSASAELLTNWWTMK